MTETYDMFKLFGRHIRKAWDYNTTNYAFDVGNIIVGRENIGAIVKENDQKTRESFFTLIIGIVPDAVSMVEKNEYFRSHWDYVTKNEIQPFLQDYISKYFPDPMRYKFLESVEIINADPKTMRSLSKISVIAKMKEYADMDDIKK